MLTHRHVYYVNESVRSVLIKTFRSVLIKTLIGFKSYLKLYFHRKWHINLKLSFRMHPHE